MKRMTMKRFLAILPKDGWRLYGASGSIRRIRGRGLYCPITAVARRRTGEFYPTGMYYEAGRVLGLTARMRKHIVDAADKPNDLTPHPRTRKRLLKALDLA